MSLKKTEELQEFLKTQENWLSKDEVEEERERLQREADERGSWNENPEEDGYWISPDQNTTEFLFDWDSDPIHSTWIHQLRNNPPQDANDDEIS